MVLARSITASVGSVRAFKPGAALSIDVEDWFHVHNLAAMIARDTWDERELRVERNTERMLELMAERGARCTCFVLGWVAEKCPVLVRRIDAAGHELATRGTGASCSTGFRPPPSREDVKRGIGLVEAAGGQKVRGYRALSFKSGRIGHAIELDPLYVDVIVRRMQMLFGTAAINAATAQTFESLAEHGGATSSTAPASTDQPEAREAVDV